MVFYYPCLKVILLFESTLINSGVTIWTCYIDYKHNCHSNIIFKEYSSIFFQVLGHIQATIGERMVAFTIVDVIIHHEILNGTYGYTVLNHTIHISLNGVSEIQFVATLVHELAHVLTPFEMNHNSTWLKTCGFLMGLLNNMTESRDLVGFDLCASMAGNNVIQHSEHTDCFNY